MTVHHKDEKIPQLIGDALPKDLSFGFDSYVEKLIKVIIYPNLDTPFAIGIEGEWGQGKTTLLNHLKYHIDHDETLKEKYKTVIFEPFRYQKENDLFLAFLEVLRLEIRNEFNEEAIKISNIVGYICTDIVFKKFIGFKGGLKEAKEIGKNYENENFLSVTLSRKIEEALKNLVDKISKRNKKLIIIIDDLDRCESSLIIPLLSSIYHFMFLNDCIFFIGFNPQIINELLLKEHSEMKSYIEIYTEKFFQLSFPIPSLSNSEIEKFLKSNYPSLDFSSWVVNAISKYIHKTPRSIKLFTNSASFIISMNNPEYKEHIIKILIIKKTWFMFYNELFSLNKSILKLERHLLKLQDVYKQNKCTECPSDVPSTIWKLYKEFILTDDSGLFEFLVDTQSPYLGDLNSDEIENCFKWTGSSNIKHKIPRNLRLSQREKVCWTGSFILKHSDHVENFPISFSDISEDAKGACLHWGDSKKYPENLSEGYIKIDRTPIHPELPTHVNIIRSWNGHKPGIAVCFKWNNDNFDIKELLRNRIQSFQDN